MEYKFIDVLGLISYTIANYKTSLISRMNSIGYPTPLNITNESLRDKLVVIVENEGLDKLKEILTIRINPAITTQADKEKLSGIFGVDPTAKSILDYISDFILPSSTTTGDTSTSTTTKTPVLNKTLLVAVVVIGVVAMFVAYKMK